MAYKNRIFLCHASEDKEFVRRLGNDLKGHGLAVWLDEWELNVGDSLREKVEEAIENSGWLAIVLTESSVESKWVARELNAAFAKEMEGSNVFILPILAGDCRAPLFLRDRIYADFREDYEKGFASLCRAIGVRAVEPGRALSDIVGLNSPRGWWWGRWWREYGEGRYDGQMVIRDVNERSFVFEIATDSGGLISGVATLIDDTHAVFSMQSETDSCTLKFELEGLSRLKITEDGCLRFYGSQYDRFRGTYRTLPRFLEGLDLPRSYRSRE